MRVSNVVIALTLAGCTSGPPTLQERQAQGERVHALASAKPAPKEFRPRDPGKPLTHDNVDVFFSPAYAFEVAASGRDDAAADIEAFLHWDPSPEEVAAAAMGLCASKSDATEHVLVEIALRPAQPPEALEALFSYYRWRGADKPAPATLPDAKLLAYADHGAARGRAALAHLGRAIKDPALVPVLQKLARDRDIEVRRAAAISMADGAKTKRSPADRERCLDALANLLRDPDAHVVASACRAVSSYTPPTSLQVQQLIGATNHADFNVRVAALEGLGKFATKDAPDWKSAVVAQMTKLATTDPSTSVRYTAAEQLAETDADAAQKLVDGLLADPSEYVRTAGVDVLGKSEDLAVNARLATIAKSDPHVRVRETAVGAFEGKKDSAIAKDAIRAALADADVGVVSNACAVVAKNEWTEFLGAVVAVPARFPGCLGADAREAALSAISDLDGAASRPLFEAFLADPNPAVRAAAEKAIAKIDKKDPPPPSRGADLTGLLLPGGAMFFDKDVFLIVETDQGTMKIRLFPDQAPVHCAHVAALARQGFYDGLTWHRVVPDFVIQGGCPRGDGSGNAGVTLPLEPTRIPFERGTLGMPRSDPPDTGGCQLFICHSRAPHLDVHYTAFGKVVEGLDVIDKIDVDSKILHVRVEGAR